jgi:ParB family chromosome partitioning protein
MARRRRVEGPSAAELQELEAGFAAKPASNPFAVPPIAQVAAEAAAAADPQPASVRIEQARDQADAETLRQARQDGRLIVEIPVSQIAIEEMTRDRIAIDREELEELKRSIAENGLRLPVEVFELAEPGEGERYGLISGLRRVTAIREIGGPTAKIAALVRSPRDAASAIVAMVEENEVRANLSHYERGRIAVLAAGQGHFADVEEAVARLFGAASKAKRSKIRSFALVHEELGDMLAFPEELTEKGGLRLAAALRQGVEGELRAALAAQPASDGASEWAAMVPVLEASEMKRSEPSGRGGRPRKQKPPTARKAGDSYELPNGLRIRADQDGRGYLIRLEGGPVDAEMVRVIMAAIHRILQPTS